jgi:transcription elongation factor GreA
MIHKVSRNLYERLREEHADLTTRGRISAAEKIARAREHGDLKENGGYHAAKDEQGKIEARIRELTDILKHAHVGAEPVDASRVASGTIVTAHIHGDEEKFLLGSREIAGDTDLDVYSENSPLGAAILGLEPGDTATFTAPSGAEIAVEIVSIAPFLG